MSNVLSVRWHTLEILCMHKISWRTRRTTTYASILLRTRNVHVCKTYAERLQRTPTYGQNISYVGIRWRYTLWCEHPLTQHFYVVKLTHLSLASLLWDIGKQHSPRCDASESGVPSGAILFAYKIFIEKWNKN